jgi:hypothetical protein
MILTANKNTEPKVTAAAPCNSVSNEKYTFSHFFYAW